MASTDEESSSLVNTFKAAVKDLYYSSESDYPFEVTVIQHDSSTSLSLEDLLQELGKPSSASVDVQQLDQFFMPLIQLKDWYKEPEIAIAQQFQSLLNLIKDTLTDVKIYRVGTIEIDIYIVGTVKEAIATPNSRAWIVLSTKAVET